jgi:cytochrome c-type biogenesis protein CcmH/NrfF
MFRFTIRDVLWLTLVIALVLGWWTDRSLLSRRHSREKEAILDENALLLHELTNGGQD